MINIEYHSMVVFACWLISAFNSYIIEQKTGIIQINNGSLINAHVHHEAKEGQYITKEPHIGIALAN